MLILIKKVTKSKNTKRIIKVFQKPILIEIQIEMMKNLKKNQIIKKMMNKKLKIIIMKVRVMMKKLKKNMNLKEDINKVENEEKKYIKLYKKEKKYVI